MNSKNKTVGDVFSKYAKEYEDKYMDPAPYKAFIQESLRNFEFKSPSVLDLGCGPGNMSKYIADIFTNSRVCGIDLSNQMIELAQKNNPRGEFIVGDATEYHDFKTKFDIVFAFFILPYIPIEESSAFIDLCQRYLSRDGILFTGTMCGPETLSKKEPSSNGEHEMLISYYNQSDLSRLHSKSGFSLISELSLEVDYMDDPGYFDWVSSWKSSSCN